MPVGEPEFPCRECGNYASHLNQCSRSTKQALNNIDLMVESAARMKEGIKNDSGKLALDLLVWLPPGPALAICRVFAYGAKKYAALNYRNGFQRTRLVASILRHVFAYLAGQDKDPATGESNLAHAGCGIMMLMQNELDNKGTNDRPKGLMELWKEES